MDNFHTSISSLIPIQSNERDETQESSLELIHSNWTSVIDSIYTLSSTLESASNDTLLLDALARHYIPCFKTQCALDPNSQSEIRDEMRSVLEGGEDAGVMERIEMELMNVHRDEIAMEMYIL